MIVGIGTLVNAGTVLLGSTIGLLAGSRLPERTRQVVTDGIGLVTFLIAASAAAAVGDDDLARAVGSSAPMLIVLGAVITGGVIGSLLRLEDRLEGLGDRLQRWGARRGAAEGAQTAEAERNHFIDGFVTSSLVFCVGPLTILGSLQEGLGHGPDQLLLKAALDGFTSIAFAAAFGWGVLGSIPTILLVQGGLTALGALLGDFLPAAHLAALTATGGVLLIAVAMRLLSLRPLPAHVRAVDLLPALVTAPLLTELVVWLR